MIIQCVNCYKKFEVEDSLIPDEGRNLTCGSCNHKWFYIPINNQQNNNIQTKNINSEHEDINVINDKKDKKIKKVENPVNFIENKKDINSEKIIKQKNNKFKKSTKKRNIDLQSYKIIFILKDVDPKDPTEELSSILSNSEVNFEIEKIERILYSKNKSMNKN